MPDFKSIFKHKNGNINKIIFLNGSLFSFTDDSIYKIDSLPENSYGYGNKKVFAQLLDGDGDFSPVVYSSAYYDLYKSIVSIDDSNRSFSLIKENVISNSILGNEKIYGLYVSDVLVADEDFGFWKNISWKQSYDSFSKIVLSLKVDNSLDELSKKDWQYYFYEYPKYDYNSIEPSEFIVSKNLDMFNLKGRYMQFKVELETISTNHNPFISDFVISYAAKHSVFFFSRKIKIEKTSNIDNLIITSSYAEPMNTEIKFGITNQNSSNWKDYKIINLDKLISLDENFGSMVKVGIKLSSYNSIRYPVVQEFGVFIGTDSDNRLNI